MNSEILNRLISNSILELRTKAFISENKMVCDNIITYFRIISNVWICLYISDGVITLKYVPEPALTTDFKNNDFAYRILKYDWKFTFKIRKISYVVSKSNQAHYFGLLLVFEDNQSISFLDDDGCILIGPIEPWLWNCEVKEINAI
ncbi:MAG: hypothetical protein BroJett042_00530 [Bacteroidota bacterium]|nr:MAG: hypothetical protein BroJett042_00530 [Bacteroidota bacterium]